MAKNKKLKLTVELPEEKYLKHITDAYGLASKYRQAQNVPHMNLESWLTTLLVEGANAIFNYHNQVQAELAKQAEAKAKAEAEAATTAEKQIEKEAGNEE